MTALANIAAALIIAGLIIGFAFPGPVTGAFLPIGLVLWCLAGRKGCSVA